jgi:hypothetical protein
MIIICIVAFCIIAAGAMLVYKSNSGERADREGKVHLHMGHGPSVGRAEGKGDD